MVLVHKLHNHFSMGGGHQDHDYFNYVHVHLHKIVLSVYEGSFRVSEVVTQICLLVQVCVLQCIVEISCSGW